MRLIVTLLLLSTIFLTACNTSSSNTSVEIASPAIPSPTITVTPTKTKIPTQPVKPTITPTTTPTPISTPVLRISPTETPKLTETFGTELHLRLKNSKGEPIPIDRAELLTDARSRSREETSFTLKTQGNLLVLSLEKEQLRQTWPEDGWVRAENYFLYLEADGYVSVRSKPMYLIGAKTQTGELAEKVVIEFHQGSKTTILKGETKEVDLMLREPQDRYLVFVDEAQHPVSDVKVKSYMFWSNSNHCGYPSGSTLLAEEISDKEGRVAIPDGEFEYLLEFEKELYHLKEQPLFDPMKLITYLSTQEIIIELHSLNKQPLEMVVKQNGIPQPNKKLYGQWIGCPCGSCPHEFATTDEKGRISLDEFYPEEWLWIYFLNEGPLEDGHAWSTDPKEFSGTEVIEVELPE